MSRIDTRVVFHCLVVNPSTKSVAQRKCKVGEEKIFFIEEKVSMLSNVGFITKTKYQTWLANVVSVRKVTNMGHMYVDFNKLNVACPKDPYPSPDIDSMIDRSSWTPTPSTTKFEWIIWTLPRWHS